MDSYKDYTWTESMRRQEDALYDILRLRRSWHKFYGDERAAFRLGQRHGRKFVYALSVFDHQSVKAHLVCLELAAEFRRDAEGQRAHFVLTAVQQFWLNACYMEGYYVGAMEQVHRVWQRLPQEQEQMA